MTTTYLYHSKHPLPITLDVSIETAIEALTSQGYVKANGFYPPNHKLVPYRATNKQTWIRYGAGTGIVLSIISIWEE